MTEPAVRMEGVGKRYRIGLPRVRATGGPLARVAHALAAPWDRLRNRGASDGSDILWAVRDVTLDIPRGEVIGFIGRNGAGKSTLLKLLARITRPTTGRITMRGRVASLLEVGTGFNMDLTGRENVYQSGAILGMRSAEITRRFDEIVAFSEVEHFLDTPVKHYSSGMYVRLAFAVAAHLETEILIVDEVLAVGDAAFQKKCLGRMDAAANQGRTILFVSHHMPTVQGLCSRAVLIEGGRITMDAAPTDVIARYLGNRDASADGDIEDATTRMGNGDARLRRVELRDQHDAPISQVLLGQPVRVSMLFEVLKPMDDAVIELGISTRDGLRVATVHSVDGDAPYFPLERGIHEIVAELDVTLLPRDYVLDVGISVSSGWTADWVERALAFSALNVAATGGDHYRPIEVRGFVRPRSVWKVPSMDAR